MEKIELLKKCDDYSIATVGNLSEVSGKIFTKDIIDTSSMEFSITTLAEGEEGAFYHRHKQNEEVYIVLSGEGALIINGEEHCVNSGSIVRVAPSAARNYRNIGTAPFTFICIQAKEGSLEGYALSDGYIE